MSATLADHVTYLTRSDDLSKLYSMSAWIVADVETSQGREVVRGVLAHIKSSSQMRVAVIHNSKAPGNNIFFNGIRWPFSFIYITIHSPNNHRCALDTTLRILITYYML